MKTEKTYDVFMACGCGYRGVHEKASLGVRLGVSANDGSIKMSPLDDKGTSANCCFCEYKKRAKRKEMKFYSEADRMRGSRPTGKYISCVVCHTVEHIIEVKK
jgi:hypothetical protein